MRQICSSSFVRGFVPCMVNIHHDDDVTSLWGIPYLYSTSGLYYRNKSSYLRFFHTTRKMPANINQQWKPTNLQSLWADCLILLQKFCQHKQIWPLRDLIWTDMSGLTTLRSVPHAFWVCSCHARHKQQRQISPSPVTFHCNNASEMLSVTEIKRSRWSVYNPIRSKREGNNHSCAVTLFKGHPPSCITLAAH